MQLEDFTPPPEEVTWAMTHNDGTQRTAIAKTAFFAAQAVGWSLSEVKSISVCDSKQG